MFNRLKTQLAATLCIGLSVVQPAYAQGLDLATKTNSFVDTVEALGLPVLILAIFVGVLVYWFRGSLGFAAAIVIGGVIFGNAPEIAAFVLG